MRRKGTLETSGSFYQEVYSISMDDLTDIWIETFHPFGTVLVCLLYTSDAADD